MRNRELYRTESFHDVDGTPCRQSRTTACLPCKWYGGLVGDEHDGGFEVGFDDGEVRLFMKDNLQELLDANANVST